MREILGKAKTVRELLRGVKYAIDYYQRDYKWHEKQIRELVDDLNDKFLEEYLRFPGLPYPRCVRRHLPGQAGRRRAGRFQRQSLSRPLCDAQVRAQRHNFNLPAYPVSSRYPRPIRFPPAVTSTAPSQ